MPSVVSPDTSTGSALAICPVELIISTSRLAAVAVSSVRAVSLLLKIVIWLVKVCLKVMRDCLMKTRVLSSA